MKYNSLHSTQTRKPTHSQ